MIDQNTKIIMSYRELEFHDKQIRAEERAEVIEEVKGLIDKRESEKCNMGSCDDCIMCCEVRALDLLLEQLKEQK